MMGVMMIFGGMHLIHADRDAKKITSRADKCTFNGSRRHSRLPFYWESEALNPRLIE